MRERKHPTTDVSAAMIAAGADVYFEASRYEDGDGLRFVGEDLNSLVRSIYLAMAAQARREKAVKSRAKASKSRPALARRSSVI